MENLIDKNKVCEELKISKQTLERYMRNGKIPYFKFGTSKNSKVLFKEQDIIDYVKNYYKKGE